MKAARLRLLARVVVVGAAVTVLPLAGPVPAASALGVPIPMGVGIRSLPDQDHATAHEVCAWGTAASPSSRWDLVITGARVFDVIGQTAQASDVTGWVIDQRYTFTSPTFQTCVNVPHSGAFAGHFQVTLAYTGIGIDLAGALVGEGTWVGGRSESTGTNLGAPPMP